MTKNTMALTIGVAILILGGVLLSSAVSPEAGVRLTTAQAAQLRGGCSGVNDKNCTDGDGNKCGGSITVGAGETEAENEPSGSSSCCACNSNGGGTYTACGN